MESSPSSRSPATGPFGRLSLRGDDDKAAEGLTAGARRVSIGAADAVPGRAPPETLPSRGGLISAQLGAPSAVMLRDTKCRPHPTDVGSPTISPKPRPVGDGATPIERGAGRYEVLAQLQQLTQKGQALLARAQAQPSKQRDMRACPTDLELECAAFEIECYRCMLRRDVCGPSAASSAYAAEEAALTAADASLAETRSQLRALVRVETTGKIARGDIETFFTALISAQMSNDETQRRACVFALRAGGATIEPSCLAELQFICLRADRLILSRQANYPVTVAQYESLVRGFAAALMLEGDGLLQPDRGLELLTTSHRFCEPDPSHEALSDAVVAYRSLEPTIRALHLADRPAAALSAALAKLFPEDHKGLNRGNPTYLRFPDSIYSLGPDRWVPSTRTAAVAQALGGVDISPASYEALQALILSRLSQAALSEGLQAVIALRLAGRPSEVLEKALIARAGMLGEAAVREEPAPRKVIVGPVVTRTLSCLDTLCDAGLFVDGVWGKSGLRATTEQRQDILALANRIRSTYIEAVAQKVSTSFIASPGPAAAPAAVTFEWYSDREGGQGIAARQGEALRELLAVHRCATRSRTEFEGDCLPTSKQSVLEFWLTRPADAHSTIDAFARALDAEPFNEMTGDRNLPAMTSALVAQMTDAPIRAQDPLGHWLAVAMPLTQAAAQVERSRHDVHLDSRYCFPAVCQRVIPAFLAPAGSEEARWQRAKFLLAFICSANAHRNRRLGALRVWIEKGELSLLIRACASLPPNEQVNLLRDLFREEDVLPPGHRTAQMRESLRATVWSTRLRQPHDTIYMGCALASLWPEMDKSARVQREGDPAGTDVSRLASLGARALTDPKRLLQPEVFPMAVPVLGRIMQLPGAPTASAGLWFDAVQRLHRDDPLTYEIGAMLATAGLLGTGGIQALLDKAELALGTSRRLSQEDVRDIAAHTTSMCSGYIAWLRGLPDAGGDRIAEAIELQTETAGLLTRLLPGREAPHQVEERQGPAMAAEPPAGRRGQDEPT